MRNWTTIKEYSDIKFEFFEGIAKITINRPEVYNAFRPDTNKEMIDAMDIAREDPAIGVVVLTGAGRGFCAGQDLSEVEFVPGQKPDLTVTLEKNYNPLIRRLRKMPLPIICAVNGVAAGGGANIAFACDIVLAARSAKFA